VFEEAKHLSYRIKEEPMFLRAKASFFPWCCQL